MNDYQFNSVLELKAYIRPALSSKVSELVRKRIDYVSEDDIFEYLRNQVWPLRTNLTLYHIVDDILNTDSQVFCEYVRKKIKNNKKE